MPSFTQRAWTGLSLAAIVCGWSAAAQAQYFGADPCACPQPIAAIPAPIVTGAVISSPIVHTAAAVNPCPCLQPVTTMEERTVQTVQHVPVQKTVKVAKLQTVMEDRDVVTYQRVIEPRTVSVPSYDYQTVTECRPMTINRSYWQTTWQPVPKMPSHHYDPRSTPLGALNRIGYEIRSAFTPNYIPYRQFVPNVIAYNQPVQRTVAVPTTRQVTYNVARLVPVTQKAQVAVQKVVWEDQTVTVMEPTTVTRTVQVPTTRMAYVNPFGGSTATAAAPTPAKSADASKGNANGTRTSDQDRSQFNLNSAEPGAIPLQHPTYSPSSAPREPQPTPAPVAEEGPVASAPAADSVPSIVRVAGWRISRAKAAEIKTQPGLDGPTLPELRVAAK